MFKAHLSLGRIDEANDALKTALQLDANDASNKRDTELMETVLHQRQMIEKYGGGDVGMSEDQDFEKAVGYCTSILSNCPDSIYYTCMKIEMLLKAMNLKEAATFSAEAIKRPELNTPQVLAWRGRVILYSGQENTGINMCR